MSLGTISLPRVSLGDVQYEIGGMTPMTRILNENMQHLGIW